MKKQTFIWLVVPFMVACSDNNSQQDEGMFASKTYDTEAEAQAESPIGQACLVAGEYKEVQECVPTNRGKNGNCEMRTIIVDTRIWERAFLRGDVDYDGVAFTRDDAQLATKKLYVKQIDNQPCPAAADIAPHEGIHDLFESDGYFTSNDINKWRDVRRDGGPDMGYVCESSCQIINHMSPEYK